MGFSLGKAMRSVRDALRPYRSDPDDLPPMTLVMNRDAARRYLFCAGWQDWVIVSLLTGVVPTSFMVGKDQIVLRDDPAIARVRAREAA